jgi:hypothetical protein
MAVAVVAEKVVAGNFVRVKKMSIHYCYYYYSVNSLSMAWVIADSKNLVRVVSRNIGM